MLNRKNSWLALVDPFEAMDHFDDDFFGAPYFDNSFGSFGTDISDEGSSYKLTADLPGFEKGDIHIDVKNDMLTVSAERHSEVEDKDKKGKFVRQERSYGSYKRSFSLGDVDADKIAAKYDNGVLTLTLPKKEVKAVEDGKQIAIE